MPRASSSKPVRTMIGRCAAAEWTRSRVARPLLSGSPRSKRMQSTGRAELQALQGLVQPLDVRDRRLTVDLRQRLLHQIRIGRIVFDQQDVQMRFAHGRVSRLVSRRLLRQFHDRQPEVLDGLDDGQNCLKLTGLVI